MMGIKIPNFPRYLLASRSKSVSRRTISTATWIKDVRASIRWSSDTRASKTDPNATPMTSWAGSGRKLGYQAHYASWTAARRG